MLKQNCARKRAYQTDVTLANPQGKKPDARFAKPALSFDPLEAGAHSCSRSGAVGATAASVDPTQNTLAPQCPRGIIYLLPGA